MLMDYVLVGVKMDKLDSIVINVRDKDLLFMLKIYMFIMC